MTPDFSEEEVLAVVDPDDGIPPGLESLEIDAALVGGSKNVETDEVLRDGRELRQLYPDIPIYQEPGHPSQVSMETIELFDRLIVSSTLNGDRDAVIGHHENFLDTLDEKARRSARDRAGPLSRIERIDEFVRDRADRQANSLLEQKWTPQSYVVMNSDCDAADAAGVGEEDIPSGTGIRRYARLAEHHLNSPILYVEGSGEYVEPGLVEEAANQLDRTHLRYGGGIENGDQIEEMLEAGADSVVIGSALEEGSYSTT